MLDLLAAMLVIAFFALAVVYADAAAWLIGPGGDNDSGNGDERETDGASGS